MPRLQHSPMRCKPARRFSCNCRKCLETKPRVPMCPPPLLAGVCVGERWRDLLQVTQPHTDDHVTLFNDLHFLMTSLGAKERATSRRLLEGLQELAK